MNPSPKSKLLTPMLVAAILRICLMLAAFILTGTSVITQGDTQSYLTPGHNLIAHGTYTNDLGPEIDRTPGYPIFVMLTGIAIHNALLVVVAQIIVSLISLWLMSRIAARVFPNTSAPIVAVWLYALEPLSILYTVRLMPEMLFILFLLIVIDRLTAFHQSQKLSSVAVAGLSLAASAYIRPVSYYLVIPLAIVLAITSKYRHHIWKAPALLLLTVIPLLALWQLRNKQETGYTGFSSIVEKNLYFYQSAAITAELNHTSLEAEQTRLGYLDEASYIAAHPEQRVWNQAQRLQFMHREAIHILAQHRSLYLRSHIYGVGVVLLTPCASEWLQMLALYPDTKTMPRRILNEGILKSILRIATEHPAIIILMSILELALLSLYLFAANSFTNPARNSANLALVTGIALYFLLIAGGAQAIGRYRLPVMPILCVLSAGGITNIRKKAGPGHQKFNDQTPPVNE